jgi:hypothetical protein
MLTADRILKFIGKVAPVRDRRSHGVLKIQLHSFVKLALLVSFIPQTLYPLGKRYRYTVNRRQIRPQERTESSNLKDLRREVGVCPNFIKVRSDVASNIVTYFHYWIQNDFCNTVNLGTWQPSLYSISAIQPLTKTEQRKEKHENNRFPERYFNLKS